MLTTHRIDPGDARRLDAVPSASVQLVVTSPPYPMIALWDEAFTRMDPRVGALLDAGDGMGAFEAMHATLDAAWAECARVLCPGGFLCVNVGDATRTVAGRFGLYPNHARIVTALSKLGLCPLPDILWRKPTNAPNKFMGSGMLPAGAYVTYEHEYVLVFRKGGPRTFDAASRRRRAESAYFWEERNLWFSDLWADLRGVPQRVVGADRPRSAAFPFELPYRLVQMYSLQGDCVLDPFAGTGTTLLAAAASARSSIGVEADPGLAAAARAALDAAPAIGARRAADRLAEHAAFVRARTEAGRVPGHRNLPYDVAVMTLQERFLTLRAPTALVWEGAQGRAPCDVAAREHAALDVTDPDL